MGVRYSFLEPRSVSGAKLGRSVWSRRSEAGSVSVSVRDKKLGYG